MCYFSKKYLSKDSRILDIGGGNLISTYFLDYTSDITIVDLKEVSHSPIMSIKHDFLQWDTDIKYNIIWTSHTLEHIKNVNLFINKMIDVSSDDAIFSVIVPHYKESLVGGHINLFTPATLCYNIILGGQNLSKATVIDHGNNIAVIWRRFDWPLPDLKYDKGDIETLANLFPLPVYQNINGKKGWDRIRADEFVEILSA